MPENLEKIRQIKRDNENFWLAIDGVQSVGIGRTSDGDLGIIISVKDNPQKYAKQFPSYIEGVSIEIQEVGEIKAF